MSHSLWPHGLQHSRPPCPSPTPRAYSNSCLLSQWCHPTISPSVIPFSSCLQSFPASGFFPMSQLFSSGGQSIGVSASTSVLPMNIQDWFPLGWTGLVFQSKGLSRVFSNTKIQKHQFFGTQLSLQFNSHIHTWLLEKPQLWLYGPLWAKWYLCFFNTLSRFVVAFLPRSKHLFLTETSVLEGLECRSTHSDSHPRGSSLKSTCLLWNWDTLTNFSAHAGGAEVWKIFL